VAGVKKEKVRGGVSLALPGLLFLLAGSWGPWRCWNRPADAGWRGGRVAERVSGPPLI